jgi:signal transduction histidine kinase
MLPRGSFERRLLLALILISLVPSLTLLGLGTFVVSETVSLTGSVTAWERVAGSGREVIERAQASGDPALEAAAARHRDELTASLVQARRWHYLIRRAVVVIPIIALIFGALVVWIAVRASASVARRLSRPIRELVGWAQRIARQEPLPAPGPDEQGERGAAEFGVLRRALRTMDAELRESRERALEDERMRSWVSMARRVAHELKNPLTPMQLAVRSLERTADQQPPAAREALEVIAAEAERIDELARSFANFGRLPEGPPSEIDLTELLDYLLRTHLPPAVRHRVRAPVDLPLIVGHHDALSRAFANLILNAADAMGGEGEVVVKISTLRGEAIEVRVLDSGPGIDPAQIEHIWEPNFTTKSRGTGLGLALVRQTVQAHGGAAIARNRPEGGAQFRVLLPLEGVFSPQSSVVSQTTGSVEDEG